MIFTETALPGAYVIDLEPHADERGFFSRTFCKREFAEHGLATDIAQGNVSYNHAAGTLRGMHYQIEPALETKLIRCIAGAIQDVIVDMRPTSPTYLRHVSVDLSAENRRSLYVPGRFAHGYLTLADDVEVEYQVSEFYTPGVERGLRYDDPALGIRWKREVAVISDKDANWQLLEDAE